MLLIVLSIGKKTLMLVHGLLLLRVLMVLVPVMLSRLIRNILVLILRLLLLLMQLLLVIVKLSLVLFQFFLRIDRILGVYLIPALVV